MDNDFSKISPTAKGSAYALSFCDIPFAKEIAKEAKLEQYLGGIASHFGLTNNPNSFIVKKIIANFAPLTEARFKSISEVLKKYKIKNILEIASGLSPRGLIMTKDPKITYIETDLPEIIVEKQQIVKNILKNTHLERPNLKFMAANALSLQELSAAAESLHSPLAIINEGLLRYLTFDEKITVAKNIKQIFSLKEGVWISPDFQPIEKRTGLQVKILLKVASLTGRDTKQNSFQNEKDLENFLQQTRFKIHSIPQLDLVGDLSSAKNFNIPQKHINQILSKRLTYILTPPI